MDKSEQLSKAGARILQALRDQLNAGQEFTLAIREFLASKPDKDATRSFMFELVQHAGDEAQMGHRIAMHHRDDAVQAGMLFGQLVKCHGLEKEYEALGKRVVDSVLSPAR